MTEVETLGILEEIGALVSDRLQVVSYKWLGRNFLMSSNTAKKLLQEFVEKNGDGLEGMYSVAGWLKKDPASDHIGLVPGPKLADSADAQVCAREALEVASSDDDESDVNLKEHQM